MRKIIISLFIFMLGLVVTSCSVTFVDGEQKEVSVIMPTGTPALALAEFAMTNDYVKAEVVAGSDPLVAAFTSKSHDVIVAPVNLGAKMYSVYQEYVLYKTFVWGNLYLASKGELNSFEDIDGKKVVAFGKNSTPDIVMQALLKYYSDINVTVEYVSDVSEANTLLASGKAEIIVTAEPSISKLKSKLNLSVLDLQEEWAKMTGNESYPQAGIFVKKSVMNKKYVKDALNDMKEAVINANANPSNCAEHAVGLHASFESLGKEVLTNAIPNCHYQILESDKEAVNYYLQMMIDLGFSKQMGGSLPVDEFYY
ncbi:MAG: transporter substrate-binding domain-containing protein [Bacilli bacterium]|nr:transporter substrate-binding domain-containing protein [Bacilli bacterium]